jgi:hypothetical protein
MKREPIILTTAAEIGGQARCAKATAARRLAAAGVPPVAVLVSGSRRRPIPLWPAADVQTLAKLIHASPETIA